jgi:small-conductance mechanosensitive channel
MINMTYDLLTISIILIIVYMGSYIFYHKDYIKKSTHIRLWNILILITFLISAGAGLVLLGLVEYGIALSISQELLYWHVQFAIAMFWIAIFHIHSYWMSPSSEKPGKESSNKSNANKTRKKADDNHTSGSSTPPEKEALEKNQGRELD